MLGGVNDNLQFLRTEMRQIKNCDINRNIDILATWLFKNACGPINVYGNWKGI